MQAPPEPQTSLPGAGSAHRVAAWLPAALIAALALAAYGNSFKVPFLFDDEASILENPTIRSVLPASDAPASPYAAGLTTSGRPIVRLTLALNYAFGATRVEGYHAVNLAIHILAGLALLGIVRRAWRRATGRQEEASLAGLAAALLWTLHPLQTEAVTYIVQRAESLMGLFYLLTLYCFVRGASEHHETHENLHCGDILTTGATKRVRGFPCALGGANAWFVLSVLSCLLGMGCKEVMVTAPVVVLLFDRAIWAGSLKEAWRLRRWYYLGLAATWIPLAVLVASTGGNRGGTSGFDVGVSWWAYWATQFEAIVRYLQLSAWPHPLVFEYGARWVAGAGEVIPYAAVVVALAAGTAWALVRRPAFGFFGAFFFLILAPTSLMPGTNQMIVEHRMYLPLAAVVVLAVLALQGAAGRRGLAAGILLAAGLGVLTHRRNADYRSERSIWEDTVAWRPGNARAWNNLGSALFREGRTREALDDFAEAERLDPQSGDIHYNYGLALSRTGHLPEALQQLLEAVRVRPAFAEARVNLAGALIGAGRITEALENAKEAVRLKPALPEAHATLGTALAKAGRCDEALAELNEALRLRPDFAVAYLNLGNTLVLMQRFPEAVQAYERAVRLKPGEAEYHFSLGLALATLGRGDEALARYEKAAELDPAHAQARVELGILLAQAGKLQEALAQLTEAVRLKPDLPEAHGNLGIVLAESGRFGEAADQYATALRLNPAYAVAHYNLGNALIELGRLGEAKAHFEAALRINPNLQAAREMLGQLQ